MKGLSMKPWTTGSTAIEEMLEDFRRTPVDGSRRLEGGWTIEDKLDRRCSAAGEVDPKEPENSPEQKRRVRRTGLFGKVRRGASRPSSVPRADTSQTPKEVIWTKNKAKAHHYQAGPKKHRFPCS